MLLLELAVRTSREFDQFLGLVRIANRNDEPSADLELRLESRWTLTPAGGDQDGIEPAAIRPALCAVALSEVDVANSKFLETVFCLRDQRSVPLDRADLSGNLRYHRRGVTRS